ncbi:S9 family peptidase [Gemmatimonas sp.]|jgi:dipeptidyl aminopeptidase/acylaminoacyl peptidase|uniref:S9 family peptidase n=1 Tax=Gemmatimonas sp. TaxID=1962908 RepID=UPI0037BEA37F
MSRLVASRRPLLALGILLATAAAPVSAQQAPTPMTADDLLNVRTVSVGDFSPDGRWMVIRVAKRGDGLGFVAARDGDPSYTRPAPARLLLVNTATGDTLPVVNTPRTIGSVAWSRDGAQLAIATRDSVPALLLWDMAAKRLRTQQLGSARLAENTDLRWTTAGTLLFAVRERGWLAEVKARFDSLVHGPISVQVGGDPFLGWDMLRRLGNRAMLVALTPQRGTLDTLVPAAQITSWTASPNGQHITWREDRTTKTNYEGGASNEARTMVRVAGGAPRALFGSMRGITLSQADDGVRYAYAKDGAIYVASLTDTTPRRLVGPAPRARGDSAADSTARAREERFTLVRMAPTGDAVVASTRSGLWLVQTVDGSRRALSTVTDTVRGPQVTLSEWSSNGRTLYLAYASRTSWDRGILRVDVASGALDTLVRDGRLYGSPSVNADGTRMALTIAAEGRPADLWLAGGRMDGAKRVLESNPQFASRVLPQTQLVSYLDADGRSQFGVLTTPSREARNLPTVFSVYESFFDDGFDATTMYLASHGYAVMKPSVTFDIGYPGEAWLKGVTASANKLIELGIADSSKLGVHGTSYGGYATNLIITQTNRFKAAINVSGKVDMISFYTDSPRLGVRNVNAAEKTQDRIGATLWEQPQKYVQHSAVMFADRIKAPLLLMTGGEDHNVPALNTREMYFALRRLGKPVEWVNYTNGGHGIPMTNATEFADWHTRLLGWYTRYLKAEAKRATTSQ